MHLAIRNPQLLVAVSLLLIFPPWKRKIVRLFANPYYFRFNAGLELKVDFGNIHETLNGPALYEMMIFKS